VKARIIEKDGASGIHNVTRILNRMDTDGSKNLDQNELMKGLSAYGIKKIPPRDMKILFAYFDRDRSGRISVDEFLRGLKVRERCGGAVSPSYIAWNDCIMFLALLYDHYFLVDCHEFARERGGVLMIIFATNYAFRVACPLSENNSCAKHSTSWTPPGMAA
jgi:hypothetical protein